MSQNQSAVVALIESLLERAGKGGASVEPSARLHGDDGLGLDSLETAELSAVLEDEFGTDPFAAGLLPETVADIVAFYDDASAASA